MKFYYFAAATLLFAVLVCARQKPFRENMHTIHRDFKYRRITQGFEKIAKMLKKLPSRRRSEAAMEFFKLGITEHSDGHFNTAMKMYKIVSPHLDKESRANAFSNLGLIYREFKGDKAVALSYFEKAVEEIPTHRNALRMAAQVYHEMKFFSSALRLNATADSDEMRTRFLFLHPFLHWFLDGWARHRSEACGFDHSTFFGSA